MNACFTFLGSQTGAKPRSRLENGGADTPTQRIAPSLRHPFPFHGLDLCKFVGLREKRRLQFLLNFLRIWLDCQGNGAAVKRSR